MKLGYSTHVGMVREKNEDSLLVLEEISPAFNVFAVADGMGGHNAGEIASKMAIQGIKKFLIRNRPNYELISMEDYIEQLIDEINSDIYEKANSEPLFNGMGTTLTLILNYKNSIHIVHVGDSRAYKVNNENMIRLTQDHSLVEELIREGKITKEEAKTHPQKNIITRAMGTDLKIQADIYHYEIRTDDKILLCSDGLTNSISEKRIKDIINNNVNLQNAADILIQEANQHGGRDNITVIIFQC